MRRSFSSMVALAGLAVTGSSLSGCPDPSQFAGDENFPRDPHLLYPEYDSSTGQVAAGEVTGIAPEQPIQFPHYTHVTVMDMQCEFCHSEARRSIHAGVPSVQTCMNCHQHCAKESPEIEKLRGFWDGGRGEPVPWTKVHDLPDYVIFSHKRHVGAGVNCTECHGQVGMQGEPVPVVDENGETRMVAKDVMVREASLQMGWCLDCHGSHPSIDENYGEQADLRRAELKDCWTCHK